MPATTSATKPRRVSPAKSTPAPPPVIVDRVPFSALRSVDAINARVAKRDGLDELAASIAAKGLIQPLAVRANGGSVYEIIDGRRRFQAMQRLVKAGTWSKDTEVPVLIRDEADDIAALETSLMANTVRLPMHPVDQFAVFVRLAETGATPATIAAHFGLAEKTVRQHMALGALAPEIREAWRKGKIDQKVAQSFTLSTDHAVQAAAYKKLARQGSYALTDHNVRSELANDRPKASGITEPIMAAYLAAGGTVSENLFEEERYIDDGALLRKLRNEAREPLRQKWLAEGWAWVKFHEELSYRWDWEELEVAPKFNTKEKARYKELEAILDGPWKKGHDELNKEREALEAAGTLRAFNPELRGKCGVIIVYDEDGDEHEIFFGMVKRGSESGLAEEGDFEDEEDKEDDWDQAAPDRRNASAPADIPADDDVPRLSGPVMESLTTTLTLATQRALAEDPLLALRAAIAALSSKSWGSSPVKLSANGYGSGRISVVRPDFLEVLAELEGVEQKDLLGRLAGLVAGAVDMVARVRMDDVESEVLRDALPADIFFAAARELFNAADYFARTPAAFAKIALEEMGVAYGKGAKKGELATLAAREAKDLGWLPPELRHPAYKLIDPSAAAAPASAPKKARRKGA